MADPRICIPKAQAFCRLAKPAASVASQIDSGVSLNDAHIFALLEYFEFLAPEQFTPLMGPGLAAEFSAITEHEFSLGSPTDSLPFLSVLRDHTVMFANAFCHDSSEEPRCHRKWRRIRQTDPQSESFSEWACMAANSKLVMNLGLPAMAGNPKLQLLKYCILKRMSEVLLTRGYEPAAYLRDIVAEEGPTPAQVLALQAYVLQKKNDGDFARLCEQSEASSQASILFWAARDATMRYLFEAWHWLDPIPYDQAVAKQEQLLHERGGVLYSRWKNASTSPAGLVRRELPRHNQSGEPGFPCVLSEEEKYGLASVPVMLIGGPGVGKTAFLCGLARHLGHAQGILRSGLQLESSDLQGLWSSMREQWELNQVESTRETTSYALRVRDDQDPEMARWMRLSFTDYKGPDLTTQTLPAEFLKSLRTARGLVFFVDNRSFPGLASSDDTRASGGNGHFEAAADVSAWYVRILQAFFDVNRNTLHLPIALVVNKTDLLLGASRCHAIDSSILIPDDVRMELVHTGLQVPKEPSTPFDRLRHCIRYNPLNSRDRKTQHLIFQLSEGFRGFISAALGQTYRFQIFLTSSIVPIGESRDRFPVGVWQVVRWMVNQLEPVYRAQSDLQLDHDRAALEQLRRDISGALLRDKEAYADFELAAKLKEERVAAKMQLRLVDKVLARDPETTEKRMESAKKRMAVALEEAFGLADFKPISAAADPAPFTIRRRMAYAALARLEEQIVYLTEWRERLFSKAPSISIATDKNRKAQASFPRVVSPISRAS